MKKCRDLPPHEEICEEFEKYIGNMEKYEDTRICGKYEELCRKYMKKLIKMENM